MITLTTTSGQSTRKHTFQKTTVVIGSSRSDTADLPVEGEEIEPIHLRIIRNPEGYALYNVANDPFATINDLPFGKKVLKDNDRLLVGKTEITFAVSGEDISTEELIPIVEKKLSRKAEAETIDPELTFREELRRLETEAAAEEDEEPTEPEAKPSRPTKPVTIYDLDDAGSEEAQKIFRTQMSISNRPQPESPPPAVAKEPPPSPPQQQGEKRESPSRPMKRRKLWLALAFVASFMLIFVSVGVYSRLTTKSRIEERRAARSVADIAMGLTYAQINGLKPSQQNWSDPQFLKMSVSAVITPYLTSYAQLDAQGKLERTPYLIRIYTNRDMSRFLILAQPEASLRQWLAPRKSIVIDSYTMELRKLSDLRSLNRLLIEPNSLSSDAGVTIAELVQNGELMPIRELKIRNNSNGFDPPARLANLHPGAENLVYNAPRYSQVGDKLMQTAIDYVTRPSSGSEVKRLTDELRIISKIPNAVLYTSQGKETAIKASKALKTLMPEERFLIAYIQYDMKKGTVNSEILNNSISYEAEKIASTPDPAMQTTPQPVEPQPPETAPPLPSKRKTVKPENSATPFGVEVDNNSPLFIEIGRLAEQRSQVLRSKGRQLADLLEANNESYVPDFDEKFHSLYSDYLKLMEQERERNLAGLKSIYEQYHVPLATFDAYILAAGLQGIDTTTLKQMQKPVAATAQGGPSEKLLARYLKKISNAATLQELDEATTVTTTLLTLDKLPDAVKLIEYQNQIRNTTVARLEELLFGKGSPLNEEAFSPENREVFQRILSTAWILDPEERTFYLSEFDTAKAKKGS